jgi:hypothetical protein
VAVAITENNIDMELDTEVYSNLGFSGTELDLGAELYPGFPAQVYVNGVMQVEGLTNDYTISGGTVTFTSALAGDDVKIIYVGGALV